MKKEFFLVVAAVLLLFAIIYVLGAIIPTIKEAKAFGEDKQEKVTWVKAKGDDERGCAVYNGEKYHYEDGIIIEYIGKEEKLLSWDYNFLFYGTDRYYSYSEETPDFLVHQWLTVTEVCINENFDFNDQSFYTEEFGEQIHLKDTYIDSTPIDLFKNNPYKAEFDLLCSAHPELKVTVQIKLYDSEYYISFDYGRTSYMISEDFLNVLKENKII